MAQKYRVMRGDSFSVVEVVDDTSDPDKVLLRLLGTGGETWINRADIEFYTQPKVKFLKRLDLTLER